MEAIADIPHVAETAPARRPPKPSHRSRVTNGRKLWTRTIGSTIVGQAVDTTLVITLTFGGIYPARILLNIIVTGYALKVGYEVIATPLTYLVINWLKRAEQSDAFDRHESFNPFSFAEKSSLDT